MNLSSSIRGAYTTALLLAGLLRPGDVSAQVQQAPLEVARAGDEISDPRTISGEQGAQKDTLNTAPDPFPKHDQSFYYDGLYGQDPPASLKPSTEKPRRTDLTHTPSRREENQTAAGKSRLPRAK